MKTLTTSVAFQSPSGVVAANGFLALTLQQNASIIGGGLIYSNVPIFLRLDANGLLIAGQQMWASDEMVTQIPYTADLLDSNRSRLDSYGPWAIVGASPIDLSLMVSVSGGISFPLAVLLNPIGNQTISVGNLTLTLGSFIETANPVTGSGNLVRQTSPTLVTPVLGVATASSINKVTLTAPATGSTITIADGKTFTVSQNITLAGVTGKTLTINKSITFDGTDGTTMTFPSVSATLGNIPTITLKKGSGSGSNYSSASTTYVVIDSTNLCYTVTIPTGWKLLIMATAEMESLTAAVNVFFAITDNAACGTANAGVLTEEVIAPTTTSASTAAALTYVINGDGNSHSIALQFKTSAGADSVVAVNASATRTPMMTFILTPSN